MSSDHVINKYKIIITNNKDGMLLVNPKRYKT